MKIVISLGGSVVVPKEVDVDLVKKFVNLIKKYQKKYRFSIVVGGGATARTYTKPAKKLGLTVNQAHEVAIKATHVNAMLLAKMLSGKFSAEHPFEIGKKKGLYTSGGYKVGWTTDTDAAYVAKGMKAGMLINVTDVKGIYTADPDKNPKAKLIMHMSWKRFEKMFGKKITGAGKHYVFDPLAGQICKKAKIRVVVVGKDLKNLEHLFLGKKFTGTIIQ
jgi:uridylate kinase